MPLRFRLVMVSLGFSLSTGGQLTQAYPSNTLSNVLLNVKEGSTVTGVTLNQTGLRLAQQQPTADPVQKPTESSNSVPTTTYDRYLKAGLEATQKQDYKTALLYFQRALDERPGDADATQAIQNLEASLKRQNLPKVNSEVVPTPTPVVLTPSAQTPAALITQQQAVDLVTHWLQAKSDIFAPPFDQQQVAELTTGDLYTSLLKPNGVISWLKNHQAYYRYGAQQIGAVEQFAVSGDRATIELRVLEDRTLYLNSTVDPKQTNFSEQQVRYTLEFVNGSWKIADYKTIDGSLLERTIPGASTSSSF